MKRFNGKSFLMGLIIGALVCSSVAVAFAATHTANLKATYRDIKIYVNGEKIGYRASNGAYAEPFIVDGTTYIPLRLFSEKTGNGVKWDGDTSSIYVYDRSSSSMTAEEAMQIAFNESLEYVITEPENGYAQDINMPGRILSETSKAFLIVFPKSDYQDGNYTGSWEQVCWVEKTSGQVKYVGEADRWDLSWVDMDTGELTDAYWNMME